MNLNYVYIHVSGKEFLNKQTLAVLEKYKIKSFAVHSDQKNAIIGI